MAAPFVMGPARPSVINAVTWNLQGSGTSKWAEGITTLMAHNIPGLTPDAKPDVLCIQEAGEIPPGSLDDSMYKPAWVTKQPNPIRELVQYGTWNKYYVYFFNWNYQRCRLALISRYQPDNLLYEQELADKLRPGIGIRLFGTLDVWTLHASAKTGGDAAPLAEDISKAANPAPPKTAILGDWNLPPKTLEERLAKRGVKYQVCEPNNQTRNYSTYDYMAWSGPSKIKGEVFPSQVNSDHDSVLYRIPL